MFATSYRPRAGDRRTASELVSLLAVGQISKAQLGLSEGETACIIVIHFCGSRVCLEVYRPQSPDPGEIPAVRTRARRAVCRMELGNGRGAILLWVETASVRRSYRIHLDKEPRQNLWMPGWLLCVGGRSAECASGRPGSPEVCSPFPRTNRRRGYLLNCI